MEDGLCPSAGVEESGARFVGCGHGGWFGEGEFGGVGEGAEVVGGHHAFGRFGVDGHEFVRGVESGGADDGLGTSRVFFHKGEACVDFAIYDKPGVVFVVVFS